MSTLRSALTAALAAALGLLASGPAAAEFADAEIRAIQAFTQRMLETAKTGSSTTWRSGDGSIGGRVTVTSTDHQPGAQPCRTYEWTMRRQGGAEMTGIGRACRDGRGDWSLEETRSERQSSVEPPPPPLTVRPPSAEAPAPKAAEKRAEKPASSPAREAARSVKPPKAEAAPEEVKAPDAPLSAAERLAELEFTRPPRTLGPAPTAPEPALEAAPAPAEAQ